MSLFVSFLFLAAGAILRYAVTDDLWSNVNEGTVGMVLLVVGGLGILLSLLFLAVVGSAASFAKRETRKRRYHRP